MTHPYQNLDSAQFWRSAITTQAPGHIDPIMRSRKIRQDEEIATIGSCFAQHLGSGVSRAGFNLFVAERAPSHMTAAEARLRNFGVFSARYGNVYTIRQAIQLFDRAFARQEFEEHIWKLGFRFVDAFRPRIEPDGFSSRNELLADRDRHLGFVRKVFEECSWLIFTLGLTEAWQSHSDGAIFPLAPGVYGGSFDPQIHLFKNFRTAETCNDLSEFIVRLASVNPTAQILLTVSPVPLIATYENRHVLVSTTYSKSALRAAADEAERNFKNVSYFPSYEIITSAANGGRYFDDDLRSIADIGIKHVMRIFSMHYLESSPNTTRQNADYLGKSSPRLPENDIVCDEEEIGRAIDNSMIRATTD